MHSDSRQRCTMFKAFVGVLSLFISGVASQTLDFSHLNSCQPTRIIWKNNDTVDLGTLTTYTFSLSARISNEIHYTLNITNVGPEGFDFTPNWRPGTEVTLLQIPPPSFDPSSNGGLIFVKIGPGIGNCTIDDTSMHSIQADIVQPPSSTPTFDEQGDSQIQCATSNVVWTGGTPPYNIQVLNATSTNGIIASIGLSNLEANEMALKVPFPVGKYAWVITDINGETSSTTFPIVPSDDASCLFTPPTSNSNESSTSTATTYANPTLTTDITNTPSATPVSAPINKSISKKSIIIAAVLGPVLGLLAVFGVGFFVYYRIRRRNREKELKMKQEVTYVPPQHARLIDVKVKPPDIE